MTTKEIINLDYYDNNNSKMFQKCLRKIKPFENEEDEEIKFELLEKYVSVACRKYPLFVDYINTMYFKDEKRNVYSSNVRSATKHEVSEIYASTMYEMFVKLSIVLYSEIKKLKVEK